MKDQLSDCLFISFIYFIYQNAPKSQSELVSMVTDLPGKVKWTVLMASGGHFAGAVFDR